MDKVSGSIDFALLDFVYEEARLEFKMEDAIEMISEKIATRLEQKLEALFQDWARICLLEGEKSLLEGTIPEENGEQTGLEGIIPEENGEQTGIKGQDAQEISVIEKDWNCDLFELKSDQKKGKSSEALLQFKTNDLEVQTGKVYNIDLWISGQKQLLMTIAVLFMKKIQNGQTEAGRLLLFEINRIARKGMG